MGKKQLNFLSSLRFASQSFTGSMPQRGNN